MRSVFRYGLRAVFHTEYATAGRQYRAVLRAVPVGHKVRTVRILTPFRAAS